MCTLPDVLPAAGARFGKFPTGIALRAGLSFAATAYAMRRSLHSRDYGLSDHEMRRNLGMGRDTCEAARRELREAGILQRWQPNRRKWAREQLLIEHGARDYRRVEAAWEGLPYKQLAALGYIRALPKTRRGRGATAGETAKRFGVTIDTARKHLKALEAKGFLRNDGTIACPIYVRALEPVPYEKAGRRGYEKAGRRGYEKAGRKLSVNPELSVSGTQGARRQARNDLRSRGIEGASGQVEPHQPPAEPAARKTGSAEGSPPEPQRPTVARALVDRAHRLGLMPGIYNDLASRLADTAKPAIRDVDAYFATAIENALARCGVEPSALPDLVRRSRSQVAAVHDQRRAAVLAEAGVALESKHDRVRRELLQRTAARFAPDRTALARAMKGRCLA